MCMEKGAAVLLDCLYTARAALQPRRSFWLNPTCLATSSLTSFLPQTSKTMGHIPNTEGNEFDGHIRVTVRASPSVLPPFSCSFRSFSVNVRGRLAH
jgi:hypothetical protein